MKFSSIIFIGLLLLSSCQSEVCKCADQWYEMTQALKKADAEHKPMDEILKKYDNSIKKCRDLDAKMSAQEKEEMISELRTCSSYQKLKGSQE
ncbi:MAG: hypothetical protein RLZZ38_1073 [Bacteroidota bacterium]|jgi:hypothetical protein